MHTPRGELWGVWSTFLWSTFKRSTFVLLWLHPSPLCGCTPTRCCGCTPYPVLWLHPPLWLHRCNRSRFGDGFAFIRLLGFHDLPPDRL